MASVIVDVPYDVEALIAAYLFTHGVDARTTVPLDRTPGMVRVSRTGGGLDNRAQDKAQVLLEVWDSTSVAAWGTAVKCWALFRMAEYEQNLGGVMLYAADVDVPRTLDDELAPELHRQQFVMSLTFPLTELTLEVPSE